MSGSKKSIPASSDTQRSILSLAIIAHGFCVALVLSANLRPSPLQRWLVRLLAPYTQTFNFDPNFTRFHLLQGRDEEDTHVIEVVAHGEGRRVLARLPDAGWRGGERWKRYHALAFALAAHAYDEVDAVSGELARAMGAHFMQAEKVSRLLVRCRRHRAQPMDLQESGSINPENPYAPEYFVTVYAADVWKSEDSSVQVLKRSARREVAPVDAP